MRHMRWSFPELLACPVDYLEVIAAEAAREAQDQQARARRH